MKKKFLLVLITITGISLLASCGGPLINAQQVIASRTDKELPREDPNSSLWDKVAEHPAKLMVQDVAEPKLAEPGVETIRVRAIHDGNWVVFRLEWEDKSRSLIPESGAGSDAAAVQFPVEPGANVPDAAMGEKGKGVRIWFWKSVWQDDIERAREGKGDRVVSLYPQGSTDHYPYQANESAREEMETRYAPARAAANPITAQSNPVQVVMAEGFGNLSPAPIQEGTGTGQWKDGRWRITIARPLNPGKGMDTLEAGMRSYVAFAVWDGAAGHTGSRKMRSGWIPLVVE